MKPHGMLCGGHFVDAIASVAVERCHRFPHILGSTTFSTMYQKFLQAVQTWADKHRNYATLELMADVRAELDGQLYFEIEICP